MKMKCRYYDKYFVIGCTKRCHFDPIPRKTVPAWFEHYRVSVYERYFINTTWAYRVWSRENIVQMLCITILQRALVDTVAFIIKAMDRFSDFPVHWSALIYAILPLPFRIISLTMQTYANILAHVKQHRIILINEKKNSQKSGTITTVNKLQKNHVHILWQILQDCIRNETGGYLEPLLLT